MAEEIQVLEPTPDATGTDTPTFTSAKGDLIDTNVNTPPTPPTQTMLKDVYISDDNRNDPTIKNMVDGSVDDMATMLRNSQKMIGGDKIAIPSKDATDQEWTDVYKKLGRPDTVEDYNFKYIEELPEQYHDQELLGKFADLAFKNGYSAKQANAAFQFHQEVAASEVARRDQVTQETLDAGREALQKEWGNAFDDKCRLANSVLRNTKGGDEFRQALKEKDLGNDPRILRFLADAVGPNIGEDRLIGLDSGARNRSNTPEAADAKMTELRSHAAFADKYHPEHPTIKAQYQELLKDKYPEDQLI